jgi:hypothetical protein
MASAAERVYELAKDGLEEQRGVVDEIRSRAAPVAAAAAVIATLLSKPTFEGDHPSGAWEWTATTVALFGVGLIVLAFVWLFSPRSLAFIVNTDQLVEELDASDEEPDLLIAEAFSQQRDLNQPAIDGLYTTFSLGLAGLLLEAVGFGLGAALAS